MTRCSIFGHRWSRWEPELKEEPRGGLTVCIAVLWRECGRCLCMERKRIR